MNMCLIAQKVSAFTGIDIAVYGFDTGKGMPAPRDYRDHPDIYQEGDFPADPRKLEGILPPNGNLILGELVRTVPQFLKTRLNEKYPLGYLMLDVDYYSSTVDALEVFLGEPQLYLPTTTIYVDDIHFEEHNEYTGELLAINEFNQGNQFRKICRYDFLECSRLFRRAEWIKHIYTLHVLDHPTRNNAVRRRPAELVNPYL